MWLAAIARPQQCDKDKVVALKVLKKVDGRRHWFWLFSTLLMMHGQLSN